MKKITKGQLANYIAEQAKKLYKTSILKEEKRLIEKRVAIMEGRAYPVTFEYTDYSTGTSEGEKTYLVTCSITPGSPGTMYARNGDPGDPPEPSEVEINEMINLETGMPIDINSLPTEVLNDISEKAEEQEGGGFEPDWDMMDENVENKDAVTFKDFKEKYNIIGSGPNGKILYADTDKVIPSFSDQEKYNFALFLANRHMGQKLGGMTWDDLSDINSLWDYIDGVDTSIGFDRAALNAVKDRIKGQDGGGALYESKKI